MSGEGRPAAWAGGGECLSATVARIRRPAPRYPPIPPKPPNTTAHNSHPSPPNPTSTTAMTSKHVLGGRYELGEVLGYGGMAEVRRGRDIRLGRDVAIKTLRSDLARDPTFQSRFRREAQSAASLNHPS